MSIGSGVLLPGVVEIPTFPILRAMAYTTGLAYRPTCDVVVYTCSVLMMLVWRQEGHPVTASAVHSLDISVEIFENYWLDQVHVEMAVKWAVYIYVSCSYMCRVFVL